MADSNSGSATKVQTFIALVVILLFSIAALWLAVEFISVLIRHWWSLILIAIALIGGFIWLSDK